MVYTKKVTIKGDMTTAKKAKFIGPRKAPKGWVDRPIANPRKRQMTGQGDYSYKGYTPGADIGGYLGGAFGYHKQGKAIGHALGTLVGVGDYTSNCNTIKTNSIVVPKLRSGVGKGFIVRRREYLSDVVSSSSANTFLIQNYSINPGIFCFIKVIMSLFLGWLK